MDGPTAVLGDYPTGPCSQVYVVDPLRTSTLLRDGTGNMGAKGQGFAAKWFDKDDLPEVNTTLYKVTGVLTDGKTPFQLITKCKSVTKGADGHIGVFYNDDQ